MFKKKTCQKCRKELKKDFEFCPYCGTPLDNDNSWGMLGKNDIENFEIPGLGMGNIFNKMIGNAFKMVENEMQKNMKESEMPMPNTKFQLYINGKKVPLDSGNVKVIKKPKKQQPVRKNIPSRVFSNENQKKFANLEKCEPETKVRRLADRIIFEISMPGVKSIEDVSIRNLENSIEIKAIAKGKAYYKIISVGLPIIDYYLDQDILVLELESKN